jgi:hypothetical protein
MEKWLYVIFLCTALSTGYAAKAQASKSVSEQEVPTKIRGNWALPDCGNTEEGVIITRHFYLQSNKDGSQLWPLTPIRHQKDYLVMPIEGVKRPVKLEQDGILKIGMFDKSPKTWPARWDNLRADGHREYMGCVEIPAIVPDPLVRVMKHMDDIESACHASLSGTCTKELFKIADKNHNGKISREEMKDAGMMLASLAALAPTHTASRDTIDRAVYDSMRETDRIYAKLGGRDMNYEDFKGFVAKADSAPLRAALKNIGAVVPGFKN